jgi:hypothetical protein
MGGVADKVRSRGTGLWLDGQESSGSKRGGAGRFDVRGSSGRNNNTGRIELTVNVCNKTPCPSFLDQISVSNDAQVPSATPTPKALPRSCPTDIRLLFPPVARKLTPREQATEMMMERELKVQAEEQRAADSRVQALREKFEAAASEKLSSVAGENNSAGRKPEVRWDTTHAVAVSTPTGVIIYDAIPGDAELHPGQRPPSRGSKHRRATRTVREIDRLTSQLRDQERVRDSSAAEVVALRQSGPPRMPPAIPPSDKVGPASQPHQGAVTSSLAADLALLR